MSVKRPSGLRKLAKRAGIVVLALIVLDLAAGIATVALGATWLKR